MKSTINIIAQKILLVFIMGIFSFESKGQNCSCISGTKNKEEGTHTFGGITSSKDYYSLLINKEVNLRDTTTPPKYTLFLTATSRALFSDSMLHTKGTFELKLFDNATMTLDSVTYINMGCCAIGFQTAITEEQIKSLSQNPITVIMVKEVLATTFASASQAKQKKIFSCLHIR